MHTLLLVVAYARARGADLLGAVLVGVRKRSSLSPPRPGEEEDVRLNAVEEKKRGHASRLDCMGGDRVSRSPVHDRVVC